MVAGAEVAGAQMGVAARTKAKLTVEVEPRKEGEEATANVFRVLGQYMKGSRTLFGQKMKDARQTFGLMDKDGSGTIDAAEFGKALSRLGFNLSKKELEAVLRVVDADGSGEVEYGEFIGLLGADLDSEKGEYDPSKALKGMEVVLLEQADRISPSAAATAASHTGAVGYHLTKEEKAERQSETVFTMLRRRMEQHWSVEGKKLEGSVEDFFATLDKDGGGTVDIEEFRRALARLDIAISDTQADELMAGADKDGDGQIDLAEFYVMLRSSKGPQLMDEEESESTVGTLDAAAAAAEKARVPQPPPVPPSRQAFEDDMADAMAVLDREAAAQREHLGLVANAAGAAIFSARRTRLRPAIAREVGAQLSRQWPPPSPRSGARRWHDAPPTLVASARTAMTPPSSPRTRSVCSARDPRGRHAPPKSAGGQHAGEEKPLWGALEWGQSRLFYPGPGDNPAQPPTTLPSGAPMYSAAFAEKQRADLLDLEARAISIEAGAKGLKKAQFNSRTRFYERCDTTPTPFGGPKPKQLLTPGLCVPQEGRASVHQRRAAGLRLRPVLQAPRAVEGSAAAAGGAVAGARQDGRFPVRP